MAKVSNRGNIDAYKPLQDEEFVEQFTYNTRQQAGRIVRQIMHKHAYGVSIYAQQLKKVLVLQEELRELGFPEVELLKPDFDRTELLEEYSHLSAYQD